jgi:hypothetical protein
MVDEDEAARRIADALGESVEDATEIVDAESLPDAVAPIPGEPFGGVNFSVTNEHGAIPELEQIRLMEYFKTKYPDSVVEDYYERYGWMHEWKANRDTDEAVKLGIALSRALGLDEESLQSYSESLADEVTETHVELAAEFHEAGKIWFQEHHGTEARMRRGLKGKGSEMLELLYATDSDVVEIGGGVMENWTFDPAVAREWGRKRSREAAGAIVRAEKSIDEFIMTIDGVAGEFPLHHDNAVTFEAETEVKREDVSFEVKSKGVRAPEDSDERWVLYGGGVFPFRDVGEQDLEALKAFVLWVADEMILFGEDREGKEQILSFVSDVRDRLERELDAGSRPDSQVLNAADTAFDKIEQRW